MTKNELKIIIKDTRDFIIEGVNVDITINIITDTYEHFFINKYDELPPKIGINNIIVTTFEDGYARSIYLKNGLKSYRKAKEYNLI